MRRSLLLLTTMALGVLMVSSVAQAASPSAKCQQAATTLGITGSYKYVGGSDRKNDNFNSKATEGVAEVFCGFGGNDEIGTLAEDDIFIGGAGDDSIYDTNGASGTFYGGAGNDSVWDNTLTGIFYGEVGNDTVFFNYGNFFGGDGADEVESNYGTFNGGADNDSVYLNRAGGTFNGGDGADFADYNDGTFNGNAGDDFVHYPEYYPNGTFNQEDPPA